MIRRGDENDLGIFDYLDAIFKPDLERILKYVDIKPGSKAERDVKNMEGLGNALMTKAENKFAKLIQILLAAGDIQSIKKAASDEAARKELYKKYNIID